ncbi:7-cyano-7-deazaguanine synthase QueC [uncultured Gimesia sp.]|uniref:7-cyano-7-deazaguanine synthase QueC n=1 Tax=uncultured Gimesia sp. TaxID=1678688 RepID=UPI00263869F0|nr:7-cyano-7-deazaguanine synthase QueC [uncultured Gimesia sp.]
MTNDPRKAIILVSGGLDSATTLAIAAAAGFELYALSFDYGQRHRHELKAAQNVCQSFNVKQHVTFPLDLRVFGGSALTADIDVPKDRSEHDLETGIPITYVPARNTVFLSLALAWAETLNAFDLFIGVNAVDYSGYPDCRPQFIEGFEKVASLATKTGVEHSGTWKIHSPLISLTKSEIIKKGMELGVDYGLTHSCYDPLSDGTPCGHCDSCQLRTKGFEEAGFSDPALNPG